MEQLVSLSMMRVAVKGDLGEALATFLNLESLSVDARSDRNAVNVDALYAMPKLRKLQIDILEYASLNTKGAEHSGLTELDVTCFSREGRPEVIKLIGKLPKLKVLRLYGPPGPQGDASEYNNFRTEIKKISKTLQLRLVRW